MTFFVYLPCMTKYYIKYGDEVFPASKYQEAIFDNVKSGTGNMIINAAAGSSKTTTIVNCIDLISEEEKILYVAFNKDIVNVIVNRVGDKPNVNVMTFHSLGFSVFRETYYNEFKGINEFKYKNYIKANIDNLMKQCDVPKRYRNIYIRNIESLVDYSRYYMATNNKEIERVAEKYGVVPVANEVDACREVLSWGETAIDYIDYTDMLWLPNVLNLTTRKHLYDRIFIDEAQDTSVVEQLLIEKTLKRGARLTAVGDTHQSINIWCGASEEAIDHFKNMSNTKEFILPISYRCPKKIVEKASIYSDNIVAKEDAADGEILYDVSKYAPRSGDMVLCRTTAPLIALHLEYLRVNKKSYIRGFEKIKDKYLALIEATGSKMIDRNCLMFDGLFCRLYKLFIEEIERVQNYYHLTYEDACDYASVLEMYDNIEGIKVLCDGLSTVDELIEKINIIFNTSEKDAILLSTVHKAKGLESENVFILNASQMPHPYAKKDWELKTERNLIYVAITRAKKRLSYIKEDKQKFYKNTVKGFLDNIKLKTGYAPRKNPNEKFDDKMTDNGNMVILSQSGTTTTATVKKKGGLKLAQLLSKR